MVKHILGMQNAEEKLHELKDSKYFKEFYEKNIEKTKQQLMQSVGKDVLVIQTINTIDELDKVANMLSKRLREWYGLYNPEFVESMPSNERLAVLVAGKSKEELLKQIDRKASMGAELDKKDIGAISLLANEINNLFTLKKKHVDYITEVLKEVAPNMTTIAGATIAARLLSLAGSLRKLVNLPASTIQILGAEKALFRHLKTGARPPKYGILHEHPLVQKAKQSQKAKVARALAEKISIASKIDFFKGEFIGDKLLKQVEAKIK
jgi:nucleolar protein 56